MGRIAKHKRYKVFGKDRPKPECNLPPTKDKKGVSNSFKKFVDRMNHAKALEDPVLRKQWEQEQVSIYKVTSGEKVAKELSVMSKLVGKKKNLFAMLDKSQHGNLPKKSVIVAKSQLNTSTPKKVAMESLAQFEEKLDTRPKDFSHLRDVVAFGEVAMRPPESLPTLKRLNKPLHKKDLSLLKILNNK